MRTEDIIELNSIMIKQSFKDLDGIQKKLLRQSEENLEIHIVIPVTTNAEEFYTYVRKEKVIFADTGPQP